MPKKLPLFLVLPTVIVLASVGFYPLIYSINISLYDLNLAIAWTTYFVGAGNYLSLLSDVWFIESTWRTLIYLTGCTTAELLLGLGIALLMNTEMRGFRTFRFLILLPMVVTPAVAGLVWRVLYNREFGMLNYFLSLFGFGPSPWVADTNLALPCVMLVDIWQWTPMMFLMLLAGLQSLPVEVLEVAGVDGASAFQKFRHVTLPLLVPTIVVAVLFRVMDALKVFDAVYLLTGGGPGLTTEVLNIYAYRIGFKFFRMGYAGAIAIFILIITMIFTTVFIFALRRSTE